MAGPNKELNKTRETICKNCNNFDPRIDPYYNKTMCGYLDIPTDAEDNHKCRYYSEYGDPL